jgi:hypothetical protein
MPPEAWGCLLRLVMRLPPNVPKSDHCNRYLLDWTHLYSLHCSQSQEYE